MRVAGDTGQWQWVSQLNGFLAYLGACGGAGERCRQLADDAMTIATTGNVAPGRPAPSGRWALWILVSGARTRPWAGWRTSRKAQLFLSHRTVGYHLYKAYPKLGIASRGELTD